MTLQDPPSERIEAGLSAMIPQFADSLSCARIAPSIAVPMHLALDSSPFSVSKAGENAPWAFLKLFEDDALGTLGVAETAAASRQAAALSLSPAVLGLDETSSSILYEWLPTDMHTVLRRGDLDDAAVLDAILGAKRTWHKSEMLAVTRSPFDLIDIYMERAVQIKRPEGTLADAVPIRQLLPWIRHFRKAFQAAGFDIAPTHGENTVSNILLSQDGSVRLVDFDRAVNADPLFDLAGFCLEICTFDEDIDPLLDRYGAEMDARSCARVRLYMAIDDFMWGLWGLIEHYASPRSGAVEFYKYAHKRFLRCNYWLGRWDVAALLRRI